MDGTPELPRTITATVVIDNRDPRANGFNYGAGWPSDTPKPAIYWELTRVCEALGRRQMELSRTTWALEMALKHIRDASDPQEMRDTVERLIELAEDNTTIREARIVADNTDNRPHKDREAGALKLAHKTHWSDTYTRTNGDGRETLLTDADWPAN